MYQYHTLPNGLRIVFRHSDSPVVYAGVYIGIGSRHEQADADQGIAHFIEHAIFKGTSHRRSCHIRNRIDGIGGELDAFTTKEETCIYASALATHLERCLELFADILFHSTFPPHEIEKEKDVVIEEINLYKDAPSELIYDDFEECYFGKHPLAHNILGSKKNVKHFTSERLSEFMRSNYTPDKMVVTVVGNADFGKLVRLCEKYFLTPSPSSEKPDEGQPPAFDFRPSTFNNTVHRRTHQAHLMVGGPAPTLYDSEKTAFTLLNNILGGPAMNARLNVAVREKQGFCYTIESQYVPFTDAGICYIYAGVDNDADERTVELIMGEIQRLRDKPLTSQQLRAAQTQFIGQLAIQSDNGLNEMQSIGKAYLNFNHVDTLDEMTRDIMALTPKQLQETAQKYWSNDNFSRLTYK